MSKVKKLSAKMVPALEANAGASMVGDISLVPALRTRMTVGEENLNTIGVIDTSSEFSMIDDELFKTLSTRPKNGVRVSLHTGLSRKQLWMYHVDIILTGDTEQQTLRFDNVPVVVANLDRKLFIIGRRGLLDKLRVDLDFPQNQITLLLERSSRPEYPSLSNEFPSLDTIIQSFDSGDLAPATMILAWEMESFVDRIIQENSGLRAHTMPGLTLQEKLRRIFKIQQLTDLSVEIQQFAAARNAAAHASSQEVSEISKNTVLQGAEKIVSQLLKISAGKKAGMTYHLYRDSTGGWRWLLKAANGRIIAGSSESYKSKRECLNDINRIRGESAASVVTE